MGYEQLTPVVWGWPRMDRSRMRQRRRRGFAGSEPERRWACDGVRTSCDSIVVTRCSLKVMSLEFGLEWMLLKVAKLLKVVAADTGGSDGSSGVVLEPWILLQLDEDLQRARCIVVDGDASLLLPGHAHEFNLTHVDEVIDELLTTDYSCDIAMPRIKKMWTLESLGSLEPRQSALEEDFEEEEENEDNEQPADELEEKTHEKDYYRGRIPARERDRDRRRESHRHRSKFSPC